VPSAIDLDIPRGRFGLLMVPAVVLSIALTIGVALILGGSPATAGSAALAVTIGSILTFAPALLRLGREHWGVAVLVFGLLRSLLILAAAWMIESNTPDLAVRPLYLGVVAGAVLILVVETAVAVLILQRIEDARQKHKISQPTHSGPAAPSAAPVEHA
jgi:hypothetical protein